MIYGGIFSGHCSFGQEKPPQPVGMNHGDFMDTNHTDDHVRRMSREDHWEPLGQSAGWLMKII